MMPQAATQSIVRLLMFKKIFQKSPPKQSRQGKREQAHPWIDLSSSSLSRTSELVVPIITESADKGKLEGGARYSSSVTSTVAISPISTPLDGVESKIFEPVASIQNDRTNGLKKVGRYMAATLKILGVMVGVSADQFVSDTTAGMEAQGQISREHLEKYCNDILRSVKDAREGDKVPQALKDDLEYHYDNLCEISRKFGNGDVDVETISHELMIQLESFLFRIYLEGYISTQEIHDKVGDLLDKQEGSTNVALVQMTEKLPRAKAAYNDYVSRDKRRVMCLEGTRQALLADIAIWFNDSNEPKIYVLSGLAGTGKSTTAQTVAARTADFGHLGASFFFSRDEADRKTAEKFFTTIAFQLCSYSKQFAVAIENVLTTERGLASTTKDPCEQLKVLILEPLQNLVTPSSRPVLIVVDAFDECESTDGKTILSALNELVCQLPCFKIFLTSRPLSGPLEGPNSHVFRLQDIEEKIVDGDIRRYLRYCLSQKQVEKHLPQLRRSWEVNDGDLDSLVRAAGRLFIIASTAVLFLLDTTAYDPVSQMEKLSHAFVDDRTSFKALNQFYTVIFRNAVPENCEDDIVERFQKVIGAVVLIQYPLPVKELAKLIDVRESNIYAVLANMQSVVLLGNDDIPFMYHKSFSDYITDEKRCKDDDLRIDQKVHQTRIAVRCFRIMNGALKQNILDLDEPTRFMENIAVLAEISGHELQEKISPHLQYACKHWNAHLKSADIRNVELLEELETFVTKHLLHWLEALSWMGMLGLAYGALEGLLRLLKSTSADLRQLLSDGLRFISKFYHIIQESALHTYYSALQFTPTGSLLYEIYHEETTHSPCLVHGGAEMWDPLIVAFGREATRVNTSLQAIEKQQVAISPDGSCFAYLDEGLLNMHETTSGVPIRSFKGDTVAFTADFSIVATAQNSIVALHGVSSNPLINTPDNSEIIDALALSFDGSQIAVAQSNGTVSLWDTNSGRCIANINDFGSQLAYSPKGYRFAFLSSTGVVRLYGGNGEFIAGLDYKSKIHQNFLFSPDGSQIASVVGEKHQSLSLTLWNGVVGGFIESVYNDSLLLAFSTDGSVIATPTRSKEKVQFLDANGLSLAGNLDSSIGPIEFLAFSHQIFAIGSYNSATLYDAATRMPLATLPYRSLISLAISLDGTRLVTRSLWGPANLWNLPSIMITTSGSTGPRRDVTAMAFSPHCEELAFGYDDGAISLWDPSQAKKLIMTSNGHSERITVLTFSPDAKRLASGSVDKTIRLWDGEEIMVITVPLIPVSLALSPTTLAGAAEHKIMLWNLETRCLIYTLENPNKMFSLLSLSPDGSFLVSSTLQGGLVSKMVEYTTKIVVWDVSKRTEITEAEVFQSSTLLARAIFLSNESGIALQFCNGSFKLFDIFKRKITHEPDHEDLGGISLPPWQWKLVNDRDNSPRLMGKFPGRNDRGPLLYIPRDLRFDIDTTAVGSSMLALRCKSGRVIVIRSSDSLHT